MKDRIPMNESGRESRTDERSLLQIVRDMVEHLSNIIRSEIRLARAEMSENARDFAKAGTYLTIGGAFAFYAFGFLLLTIVYALQNVMPSWGAALVVAVGIGLAAGVMYIMGRNELKHASLKPEKTIESVEENVKWLKSQTK